jgi:hypothetical protein
LIDYWLRCDFFTLTIAVPLFFVTLVFLTSTVGGAMIELTRKTVPRWMCVFLLSPAVLFHEVLHIAGALPFGLHVGRVRLAGAFQYGRPVDVQLLYNSRNLVHHIGLMMSSWAPVIVPSFIYYFAVANVEKIDTPVEIGLAVYAAIILANTTALSRADWRTSATGLVVVMCLIAIGLTVGSAFGVCETPWRYSEAYIMNAAGCFFIGMVLQLAVLGVFGLINPTIGALRRIAFVKS